jgi:uncharacterized glyoxalase superfamily protein PhnB
MADERDDPALAAIESALANLPDPRFRARLRERLERSIRMAASTGQAAVTPYVMAQDIEPVIAFAKRAFGAEEIRRGTGSAGGTHCELRFGDSVVMFGGAVPGEPIKPRLVGLHIYVDDVDAVYQRAIEAGATSLEGPADRHYGERSGFVRDAAGNLWYIATRTAPTYFAKEPRTVIPNLYVQRRGERGARQLLEFLENAFAAETQLFRGPDGEVQHGVVWIYGAPLELGEGDAPVFGEAPAALVVNVADCQRAYEAALAAGGTALFPPAQQPYGVKMAGVADPVGNEWYLEEKL